MSNLKHIANGVSRIASRPFRVSIEGNIGSGKSTCINFFDKFPNVETHAEPLHEWRNVSGHNLFGLMYSDMHKWTFPFQHYVHLSRLKIQTSPPINSNISVKMFERSVQNSRYCFVENSKKQNYLKEPEYEVLLQYYDCIEKNLDIALDLIVYLKTTPEVVWERMMKRGRSEESEIPLGYLQEVHDSYEEWLSSPNVGCEVLTIDANKALDKVTEDLQRLNNTLRSVPGWVTVVVAHILCVSVFRKARIDAQDVHRYDGHPSKCLPQHVLLNLNDLLRSYKISALKANPAN